MPILPVSGTKQPRIPLAGEKTGAFRFLNWFHKNRILALSICGILLLIILFTQNFWLKFHPRLTPAEFKGKVDELQGLATKSHDYSQCIASAKTLVAINPSSMDAWYWKGVCEFSYGSFADSKVSLEKVLTFDPENAPAKYYLSYLNDPNSTLVRPERNVVTQKDFEAYLDFVPDPAPLKFFSAYTIPGKNGVNDRIISEYHSTQTYLEVLSYIRFALNKAGVTFHEETRTGGVSIAVTSKKSANTYVISLVGSESPGSPVSATITLTLVK